jgi:hypothetical protein
MIGESLWATHEEYLQRDWLRRADDIAAVLMGVIQPGMGAQARATATAGIGPAVESLVDELRSYPVRTRAMCTFKERLTTFLRIAHEMAASLNDVWHSSDPPAQRLGYGSDARGAVEHGWGRSLAGGSNRRTAHTTCTSYSGMDGPVAAGFRLCRALTRGVSRPEQQPRGPIAGGRG